MEQPLPESNPAEPLASNPITDIGSPSNKSKQPKNAPNFLTKLFKSKKGAKSSPKKNIVFNIAGKFKSAFQKVKVEKSTAGASAAAPAKSSAATLSSSSSMTAKPSILLNDDDPCLASLMVPSNDDTEADEKSKYPPVPPLDNNSMAEEWLKLSSGADCDDSKEVRAGQCKHIFIIMCYPLQIKSLEHNINRNMSYTFSKKLAGTTKY